MKTRSFHWALFALLFFSYPVGKIIQEYLFLPRFMRFHLADLGFVPCIGYSIAVAVQIIKDDDSEEYLINKARVWSTIILVATIIYELMSNTDYIDVASYITGYCLGLFCLPMKENLTNSGGTPARFKGQRPKVTRKTKHRPRRQ